MPLTFSHPAIVLPIQKFTYHKLSWTGLIIGSITPDFEYFIRMKVLSIYSHTLPGLLWFDLPLGLLLTFVYHLGVRNSFIQNLPGFLNKKLNIYNQLDWKKYFKNNWPFVLISILVGAASHILWDDFTHPSGYFVKHFKILKTIVTISQFHAPLFNILQHLSSLVGGLIVVLTILRLKNNSFEKSRAKIYYWLTVSAISLFIISLRFFCGLDIHLYGNVVVTIISASLISLILTPIILKMCMPRSNPTVA